MMISLIYPCRDVGGEVINIDVLLEVLGDETELLQRIEDKNVGTYGTVEKDLKELSEGEGVVKRSQVC